MDTISQELTAPHEVLAGRPAVVTVVGEHHARHHARRAGRSQTADQQDLVPVVARRHPDRPRHAPYLYVAEPLRGHHDAPAAVVGAGRPTCPFCGQPIDPEGHLWNIGTYDPWTPPS